MINYEDFAKVELRTAKVLEANIHSNADKLYVLKIDLGDKTTQIVAGIRNYYTPEELIGKSVVIVANLEPKTIRGVESNGMLLAAHSRDSLAVLTLDRAVEPGSPIK
jgi:methionyl-tRNA synthetase